MKRLLACILTLALACALLVPAAAAADVTASNFSDWDQVVNQSQVAMLVDLGLISGYADGSFRPYNCITRAETAKIVSGLLSGQAVPDVPCRFADAADSWAASYIQFCVDQGVLSGYEDGTFRPGDYVTIRQLAKMLLAVLGRDTAAYTGSAWAQAVDADAQEAGLYDGLTSDPGRFVTRDEVCLLIGNALQSPVILGYSGGQPQYALDEMMLPISLLQYRFYLIPVTGVVVANAAADLRSAGGKLEGNLICIAGYTRCFSVSPAVASDVSLLGHEVTVYAQYGVPYHQVFGLPGIRAQEQSVVLYSLAELDALMDYDVLAFTDETRYCKNLQPDDKSCLTTVADGDTVTLIDHEGDGQVDMVLLTTAAVLEARTAAAR